MAQGRGLLSEVSQVTGQLDKPTNFQRGRFFLEQSILHPNMSASSKGFEILFYSSLCRQSPCSSCHFDHVQF